MNQEMQTYDFHGNEVRALTDAQNDPWFIAKDICDILGLSNVTVALSSLDEDEVSQIDPKNYLGSETRSNQPINIVSEAGFYKLVLRSRKPVAKEFQRWVTHDVLPSIRQHGAYMTQQTIERVLTDPDTLIRLATDLKHEREARAQAERQVRSLAPKAQAFEDFVDVPDLLTIREAAKLLTTADIQIRESELRAWLVMHKWIYRKGGDYEPYASHVQAGHIRLVAHKSSGRHSDGSRFAFAPTCKLTRRGLILLYQRIGSEQMRNRLPLTTAERSEQPDWWQEEETANVVSVHE
ncbi:antirepressor [Bifidobacterium animalis subsp. animalis MCC 0483]|uniref:Antirepressor n=1 Tax=Bifidobacterium animalis subsp. animalis MCC 0483 TaxID=1365955 RepID=A0AB34TBK5_9BIFI|nr:phage antirepressor [Bifidobacterium animalis]KOA51608.1 antirepressor [Bifidobacterium animalis subsp. animalis MCC 0483]